MVSRCFEGIGVRRMLGQVDSPDLTGVLDAPSWTSRTKVSIRKAAFNVG